MRNGVLLSGLPGVWLNNTDDTRRVNKPEGVCILVNVSGVDMSAEDGVGIGGIDKGSNFLFCSISESSIFKFDGLILKDDFKILIENFE